MVAAVAIQTAWMLLRIVHNWLLCATTAFTCNY
uniref:Uncharacterized protein n=1 Tax=Ascaris lumbricoides TaxID=6252 RepID=A0A0M3IPG8_ASCLU